MLETSASVSAYDSQFGGGGIGVYGDAVLVNFSCGISVISILTCGIAVLSRSSECGF